jgi:hypothetical protein
LRQLAASEGPRRADDKTLQDRLVKELRLRGISTMEGGNAFLPQFMADYNPRFGQSIGVSREK